MGQNDDHIEREDDDPARTLDAGKLLHEIGSHIGHYKLLRILGEGGMGIVYLAEQQRPMRRQVALKIIKPGMDSAQVIRRFEAERQALALLDHPNVAHVYDAGTTEAGRPYFAMEYVKGVPITEHCDRQKLTIEERLKLFVQVCEAIQHAHQKGIIHRDIKPSNIQVCIQGEQAIPKVIDFGVAKALSQPLTERTLVTEQGQLIGTPEYISPEQAEMTNQDIDTRSDIYSLGVVLYELLTGTLPFESQTLRRGSLDQMRQIIRETEPKTPSTRVSALDAETLTRVARSCQSDAATLRRGLRGDLDWITLKAMEKDRTRRYQTPHALAEDIERHLNNEPVLAGRPGTFYRFGKLVRRNRAVFAALFIVAASLVMGLTVSAVALVREQHARRIAVAAQEKEATLRYASDMSLAQQALADDLGRALRLLEDHRPKPGEIDLRGWEWRYLWQECRSDALGELARYPPSAHSVAYSPDGKMLAVAGYIREFVDIWDVFSRRPIKSLLPNKGHLVAFSPRGDLLATGVDKEIRLWRTDTWNLVGQLSLTGDVNVFKFSSDGRRLASLSEPNDITLWDVEQQIPVRRIPGARCFKHRGEPHMGALDFSPDGRAVVFGGLGGRLRAVDLASGDTTFDVPEAHPERILCVAWSPDGGVIASGGGYSGGSIQLWEAGSGKPLGSLSGHTAGIFELLFSADGQRLYSASADQTIRVWSVGQQQRLATLRGSRDILEGLALSPNGSTLASAGKDGVVAFWDAYPRQGKEQPCVIPWDQSTRTRPAWGPAGRVWAVARTGIVHLLDVTTTQTKEIEQVPALGTDVTGFTCSPDGTLLAGRCPSGKTRVWSCAERRLLKEWDDPNVFGLLFQGDGGRLVSLGPQATWRDSCTWEVVRRFPLAPELLSGLARIAVSPEGRFLVVGTQTGVVRWLSGETGELLAAPPTIHRCAVVGIAFSKDGARAATVAEDGTLVIWDPSSFQPIAAVKGHVGAHAVAFSPDGRRLATGGGFSREAVKIWDLSTCRDVLTLPGQGSVFWHVTFSPDGQWLAALNSQGKELHLWRAPSWAEIEAAENQGGSPGSEQ